MEPMIGKVVEFKPPLGLKAFGKAHGLKARMIGKVALKYCYQMMGLELKVHGGTQELEPEKIFPKE
jgi:hypothetical protein